MERDQRTPRSDVPPVPPASGASRSASTAAAPEPNGREARTYPSLSFRQSSQRSQKSFVLSMKLASARTLQARRSDTGPGRWVDLASLKASRSRMYALGRAGRSRSRHFYDKNLSKPKFSLHTGTVLYRYSRSLPVRGPLPLVRPPSDWVSAAVQLPLLFFPVARGCRAPRSSLSHHVDSPPPRLGRCRGERM